MRAKPERLLLVVAASATVFLAPWHASFASSDATPVPWVSLAWDHEVGRVLGNEADSEGPASFAIKPNGNVLVLDQINLRIRELGPDGLPMGEMALPAPSFDDVEHYEGKAVLALDRLVGRTLLVLDNDGSQLAQVPVEGRGISDAGTITALLPRPDGVWLEVNNRHSVKVLDRTLRPCERQIVMGRPMVHGRSLLVELDGNDGARVSVIERNGRATLKTTRLGANAPVQRIVWSDVDAEGRAHVAVNTGEYDKAPPYRLQNERAWIVVYDEELNELSRTESPWLLTDVEQRMQYRLGPDGHLWQMSFATDGVKISDWGRRAK